MRVGYSFWGFLGPGVVDTPDGGRSHRRTLVDGLIERGHEVVFLQPDRDLAEAGDAVTGPYRWDAGLPEIDTLMLEWRWPIPGRNTTWCGAAGHTCDLHRQHDLINRYTHTLTTPTIVWDKDRKLPADDPMRTLANVTVCEPALHPSPGAVSLLFPVADRLLDAADPNRLATAERQTCLAYVGNQYDRDDAFDAFFAQPAARVRHIIAGKWGDTSRWPGLNFHGRVGFPTVEVIHGDTLATVLLLPDRYARVGHMTQRLFEAVLAGCAPITPTSIRSADQFTPEPLHVATAADVVRVIDWLTGIAGTGEHAALLAECLGRLEIFRGSRQLNVLDQILCGAAVPAG